MITLNKTMYLTRSTSGTQIFLIITILRNWFHYDEDHQSVSRKHCLDDAVKFYCDRGTPTGVDMIISVEDLYTIVAVC